MPVKHRNLSVDCIEDALAGNGFRRIVAYRNNHGSTWHLHVGRWARARLLYYTNIYQTALRFVL
jgi:hypothetical protein